MVRRFGGSVVFGTSRFAPGLLAGLALLVGADRLWACAVCFGDPDSDLAKGAVSGVLVLFGFVATVLVGIGSIAVFWIVRARKLRGDVRF